MTALTYMIDRFYYHSDRHPYEDHDNIMDRVLSDCEYVGIDFGKIARAAFGG